MSANKINLSSNEFIIYISRPHWFLLAFPFFLLIVSLIITLCLALGFPRNIALSIVSLFIIAYPVILLVKSLFRLNLDEQIVTNKRVIIKQGWPDIKIESLELKDIYKITVKKDFFQKKLGYGTVIIEKPGFLPLQISYVTDPFDFRQIVLEAGKTESLAVRRPKLKIRRKLLTAATAGLTTILLVSSIYGLFGFYTQALEKDSCNLYDFKAIQKPDFDEKYYLDPTTGKKTKKRSQTKSMREKYLESQKKGNAPNTYENTEDPSQTIK